MFAFLEEGLLPYLLTWFGAESDGARIAVGFVCLILIILVSYLLGSVNSAILVSRIFYHKDIRTLGSKNAGATNMHRVFGLPAGLFTLLGDIVKTFLAVGFSFVLVGGSWVLRENGTVDPFGSTFSLSFPAYVAALFCILGHIFPVYYRFRGGKGVLCAAVAMGMLSPWLLLIELVVFFGTVAMTKYVSLGSILSAATYPLFYATLFKVAFSGMSAPGENILIIFLIAAILVWAHRGNIGRLRRGEEPRISFRRRKKEVEEGEDALPDEEDYDL